MCKVKLPKRTQELLNQVGKDNYELVTGGAHLKLYVFGQFCGVLPKKTRGDGDGRWSAELNTLAQIKRVIRAVTTQPIAAA